ncbi:uncharacterized protein [Gossypium hirsutum]|uniref:Tf2-1-like SH3-like domain-containing protein n=1 Tax=Gossypium hirsutum TaxID=3635 RepID=A0A1U8PKF3_GOSHI|nr:uncharacterized protein LOC107959988 [Gossypium hirsutum]
MFQSCAIDFGGNWDLHFPLAEFMYKNNYQKSIQRAPFEALYGKKCRTPLCWFDMEEKRNLGPDLVCEVEDKVGNKVFLKVSPWNKVLKFGWKGKLSPRFIGPYEVIKRIGPVSYHLLLLPELERIHDVFLISMLRKYRSDPSHVIPVEEIEIRSDLSYEEESVVIQDLEIKMLCNKTILLVKVLWHNCNTPIP